MNISSLPDLDISGADLIAEYGTSLFSNVKKNAIKNEEKLEIKSEPIGKMEEIKSEPIGKMEENESENVEKDSEIEIFTPPELQEKEKVDYYRDKQQKIVQWTKQTERRQQRLVELTLETKRKLAFAILDAEQPLLKKRDKELI